MVDVKVSLESRVQAVLSRARVVLEDAGVEVYAVGGFVRDLLLERPLKDLDLAISGNPSAVGRRIADELGAHYFALDEERGLVRVLVSADGLHIDIAAYEGSIENDLRRRDFTVNAMGAPLAPLLDGRLRLLDPTGGLADLKAKRLRVVSEQAFLDDPLRLLRGVRLAVQLGLDLGPETAAMIRRHAGRVRESAAERQRDELLQLFSTSRAGAGVRLMEDLSLLSAVLPELEVARGVEQPKEHQWDVFTHQIETLSRLDWLLAESEPAAEPERTLWTVLWQQLAGWPPGRAHFTEDVTPGVPRSASLKIAALLHDMGKPATKSREASGRIRFFRHEEVGAQMAERLLRRLHFPTRQISLIRAMIDAHLRPLQMAQEGPPTDRAIYRFFRDTGEAGIDTLFLSLADHLATAGPRLTLAGWRRHVAVVGYTLERQHRERRVVRPPRLVDGDDLMAELGLAPGPLIGELLETVREAHAAGEVSTREEALALARRQLAATEDSR